MNDVLNPPSTDEFPRSQALSHCLQSFGKAMAGMTGLSDSVLTARVVGEFSAGKTRLLRELVGNLLPDAALCPISSVEPQTRLQLEITYGDAPVLELVEREADYQPARTVERLTAFPERRELMACDPLRHRLRLSVPEPRLILRKGDGNSDDNNPKRLFLIDTPGWNSGEDALAERDAAQFLAGYLNLALVYVSQASRLDGALNAGRLREFLAALAAADFLDRARLVFVVTGCPPSEVASTQQRARALVEQLWCGLDNDPEGLDLEVLCIDFQALPEPELQQFRERFWRAVLAPLGHDDEPPQEGWAASLGDWPPQWDVQSHITETAQHFARAKRLLERARQGDEFIAGMNMYRLMGLEQADLQRKLNAAWLRQLGCGDASELRDWLVAPLPEGHPLQTWWHDYWQSGLNAALAPVQRFFDEAWQAINGVTPELKDLQAHLTAALVRPYAEAWLALDSSFACLVRTAQDLQHEPARETRIATLLTLSVLQARYEDHLERHAAAVSGIEAVS